MPAPFIDPDSLRRRVGGAGYERGVSYFRGGAVRAIEWNEASQTLTGTVDGSGGRIYRCTVRIDVARTTDRIMIAQCTCPLARDCKHAVATVLSSNARLIDPPAAVPRTSTPLRPAAPRGAASSPAAPTWRDLLPTAAASNATVPLALGVELRRISDRGSGGWRPRQAEPVTAHGLAVGKGELLVGLRPLMRSARTQGWIKGDVSWDSLRRPGGAYDADQARWFAELHAISREVRALGPFVDASEWITLDTISSALLWHHLRAGRDLGIPLVGTRKDLTVRLAEHAMLIMSAEPAPDGGLSLAPQLTIDDDPVAASAVRPITRTGLYAFVQVEDHIDLTLAPLALSDATRALLDARAPIEVPAAEADMFLRDHLPRLARRIVVDARDGLELPPLGDPVLVIEVAFRAKTTVEVTAEWEYPGLGRFPLRTRDDRPEDSDRDGVAESAVLARAQSAWSHTTALPFAASQTLRGVEAAEFVVHTLLALDGLDGVRVDRTGAPPNYQELSGIPEITISTVESTDPDWFDLGVIVTIDGRRIPFVPLFTALTQRRTKILLSDGAFFSLAHPALDRLRELVDEAAEVTEWEAGPRISRHQVDLWADFEDLADQAEPAVSWRATAEGLRDIDRIEATELPAKLVAELRPYQRAGFDWLAFLWRHRLGGILADDMGLGKTLQMLALIAHAHETGERRPFLVVAPTSVMSTWQSEAQRFAPHLVVRVIDQTHAKSGMAVADAAAGADVIVTSYTLLRLDSEEFSRMSWAALVLDEAQFVKNAQTKLHRAARDVGAPMTFAITGTPLENSLTELWAL
ncbi:MAG: DEAD/DEAH box helicase family protein, partial [Actinobacteria bacterium]|nr:DEAD/DEAH box helicase family protein [Actinomycetota bacterium]